jgi:hypothetical protein
LVTNSLIRFYRRRTSQKNGIVPMKAAATSAM